MDYRQVEVFEAVVTLGSVTQAARRLGVTQPAVSAALAKLERSVGFDLFRREGRRLLPTPEAMLLHGKAFSVLSDFRGLTETAAAIAAGQAGTLTIASNPGPSIAWLPAIAAQFCRDRRGVRLRLLTRSSAEVRDLAVLSAFDLGIAEAPFTRAETLLRRYSFARVVALSSAHRLAAETEITPRMLDGEDMIATVNSSWSWSTVERAFEAAGARCHVVAECEFTAIAINMVAAGLGVCISDPLSVRDIPDVVVRPFRPILPYDVGLLRPVHGRLTRLAEAFAADFHTHVTPYLIEA